MDKTKVTRMADRSGKGSHSSIEDALTDALDFVGKKGAFEKGKKVLILALDDTQDNYSISFVQAGMKMSECNNLCDVAKEVFKDEMGY